MELAEFIRLHPPREPNKPPANEDELRRLGAEDGVQSLDGRFPCHVNGSVPERKGDPGCHLWVFHEEGAPYVLERAMVIPALESGLVKHTNLTGGGPASAGGEIWFAPGDDRLVYVNGCSGRYAPQTPEQMEDLTEVVRGLGYEVESFGWDDDADRPAGVLRR